MTKPLWKVALEGEGDDLLALSNCFTDPECVIQRTGSRFYLMSSQFDADPESYGGPPQGERPLDMRPPRAADDVRRKAVEMLSFINGAALLAFVPYKAVRLGPVYGFYEGDRHPFVTVEYGVGGSRMAWERKFATESPDPAKWVRHAEVDLDVAEALDLFGLQPESDRELRRNLYSILEIIRSDVGGDKAIAARGWASHNEIELCGRSLNLARHARPSGSPPPKPMMAWESTSLIRRLMQSWIAEKGQPKAEP